LGTQFRYLGTQPLELGPLLHSQCNIVCHGAAVSLVATMAPSLIEIAAVITRKG